MRGGFQIGSESLELMKNELAIGLVRGRARVEKIEHGLKFLIGGRKLSLVLLELTES